MGEGHKDPRTEDDAEESGPPRGAFLGALAWAWIAGAAAWLAAGCLGYLLIFDSVGGAAASIDFNGEFFADLLGPYWRTAESLAAGQNAPDPQYLYPATLAVLLEPLARHGPTGASWTAVCMGALSVSLLLGAALLLHRPRRAPHLALFAAALFLSFPIVHGVYWANAGPLSLGAAALGWCLAARGREGVGGALIGFGAAIKVLPVLLIVGLARHGKRRAAWVAAAFTFALAVLLPWLSMGTNDFLAFHGATVERLGDMAGFARTPFGGRGSQDVVAVSARLAGHTAPWWGLALGVLAALWALGQGVRSHPTDHPGDANAPMDRTLLWFLAAPGLLISPTWAHGLTWLPLVWCWAAPRLGRSGVGWAFLVASMAVGSLPAAWLTGDPTLYLVSAAPFASSLFALCALQIACRAPARHGRL